MVILIFAIYFVFILPRLFQKHNIHILQHVMRTTTMILYSLIDKVSIQFNVMQRSIAQVQLEMLNKIL